MKKICLAFTAVMILLAFASTGHTVTSSLDNVRGGAGIAYWQAAGGWTTLVNVQEAVNACANIHVGVYDRNDTQLIAFNLLLRPNDNVGVVVEGDGINISLYDYSDSAYGGTAALNNVGTVPVVLPAPAGPDGIQRGYMMFVRTNTGCGGPGGAPNGNITGAYAIVPDNLFIRSAMLNPNSAFAVNAAMLQGFGNQNATLSESIDFIDSTNTPNIGPDPCDFNQNGNTTDTFPIMDDAVGAEIDFVELFLSDNINPGPPPWIICDGGTSYRGLGAHNGWYCSRYNSNPSVGTSSILVLVAPQSAHSSAIGYNRSLTAYSFDDEGNSVVWSSVIKPVAALPFGAGGITIGGTAGESCFYITAPVFGFSFTESASFADLYPIGKSNVGIATLNQDFVDDAVDVIHVP